MAMRNYTGPLLPDTGVPAPTPAPEPVSPLEGFVQAAEPLALPPFRIVVEIHDTAFEVKARGTAATVEEALRLAVETYERELPVQPLVWADGSPVTGLAHQVLAQSLEMYAQHGLPPEVKLMIGRLLGALGEEQE